MTNNDQPTIIDPINMGPCGKPCDQPCDQNESFDEKDTTGSSWLRWMNSSLFNTLDVCFDDVYREPKKILIIGGCRQMALSQHIALLLPAADISLVDSDESIVERAKEEICCRFKFITAPLEALPFESNTFDLTIAHNFLAYPQQWQAALSETSRVTSGNLFLTVHRPLLWSFAQRISGMRSAMKEAGLTLPESLPEQFEFLTQLTQYAKIKTKLVPFPWTAYMTNIRPSWEEKLVLAS